MAMGTARGGFVIIKAKPTQNLNYQTHLQPAAGFNFFTKTHLQRVLTITKPAMVSGGFFAGFRI